MEKRIYLNKLYDCYRELFTDKQKEYFEAYYWDNLSLSEIGENNDVSRNAVYNQLKLIEEKLIDYEDKLNLEKKREKLLRELEPYDGLIERIKEII